MQYGQTYGKFEAIFDMDYLAIGRPGTSGTGNSHGVGYGGGDGLSSILIKDKEASILSNMNNSHHIKSEETIVVRHKGFGSHTGAGKRPITSRWLENITVDHLMSKIHG